VTAGRVSRLTHVVMQVVNHSSYPLQILLIVPFVRLGETITGSGHIPLTPTAIIAEFNRSFPDFVAKFWMAYVHGVIGWVVTALPACWALHFVLRATFRKVLPQPSAS